MIPHLLETALANWLVGEEVEGLAAYAISAAHVTTEQVNSRILFHVPEAQILDPGVNLYEVPVNVILVDYVEVDRTLAQHRAAADALLPELQDTDMVVAEVNALNPSPGIVLSGLALVDQQQGFEEKTAVTTFKFTATVSLGNPQS